MAKAIKNHLIGNGKTLCGINYQKDSIRLAELDTGKWYNDYGDQLDTTNWESIFCMSCLKLHEKDLIEQFKMQSFLIAFNLNLPNSNRLRKKAKATAKRNWINKSIEILEKRLAESIPTKKPNKPIESKKPTNSIPKSEKGLAREKRKAQSKSIDTLTENKCKIISKPDKPIELTPEMEVETKEVIEKVDPADNWSIGDPIDDDIFELSIGDDWKLIRHNKQLDKWQFQSKQVVKGLPKWIAESDEYIDYKDAAELVIDGYCE